MYGQVYDEETEIGIHPCDVTLVGSGDVIEETYEDGFYVLDALSGSGYKMKFESPEYETKTISNVDISDWSFQQVDVALKKKEAMTEDDSLLSFINKAPQALKDKIRFLRNFYKMQKKQEDGSEKKPTFLKNPYRD